MIINMTPHDINVIAVDGEVETIPASGQTVRLKMETASAGSHDGIPLTETVFGSPEGLPPKTPGTLLIVSQIVKSALPLRRDLVVPAELVRDAEGRIIGCRSLGI